MRPQIVMHKDAFFFILSLNPNPAKPDICMIPITGTQFSPRLTEVDLTEVNPMVVNLPWQLFWVASNIDVDKRKLRFTSYPLC